MAYGRNILEQARARVRNAPLISPSVASRVEERGTDLLLFRSDRPS